MRRIKKCPWCGEKGRIMCIEDGQPKIVGFFVTCPNEDCPVEPSTAVYDSGKDAVVVWNRRGRG